jgi:hypothetical protein
VAQRQNQNSTALDPRNQQYCEESPPNKFLGVPKGPQILSQSVEETDTFRCSEADGGACLRPWFCPEVAISETSEVQVLIVACPISRSATKRFSDKKRRVAPTPALFARLLRALPARQDAAAGKNGDDENSTAFDDALATMAPSTERTPGIK